jgi:tetratricopeptide (TPR) repeat protein
MITNFSLENIRKIFSSFFIGNYHPLAILSTSIDYALGGLDPKVYHLTNVALHLLNTILVFRFVFLLTANSVSGFLTALVWAIHPMHVESVAWISERKDVLYTFFFFLSLISYLHYTKTGISKYYFSAILLFICSILSKGQAVVLSPILFLIDYLLQRNWNKRVLFEKLPFFILSVLFGIIAIYAQDKSINMIGSSIYKSFFYGCHSFLIYSYKAVIPVNLSAFYPYSLNADGSIPLSVYLAPLACFLIFILIYKYGKTNRMFLFGSLFFIVSIFPVLQFLPVGRTMISERYSYVPYLGIFIIAGDTIQKIKQSGSKWALKLNPYINYAVAGIVLMLVISTRQRCKVWKDSVSLWTDVLAKHPDCRNALQSRGFAFMYININYPAALADFNKQVGLDSTDAEAFFNRGVAFTANTNYYKAIADYKKVLRLDTTFLKAYENLGMVYIDNLKMYTEGISVSLTGLKVFPYDPGLNQNCGAGHYKTGQYAAAIHYYTKALRASPDKGRIWLLRALCYSTGDIANYKQALKDALKAKELGELVEESYFLKLKEAIRMYSFNSILKNSVFNV